MLINSFITLDVSTYFYFHNFVSKNSRFNLVRNICKKLLEQSITIGII